MCVLFNSLHSFCMCTVKLLCRAAHTTALNYVQLQHRLLLSILWSVVTSQFRKWIFEACDVKMLTLVQRLLFSFFVPWRPLHSGLVDTALSYSHRGGSLVMVISSTYTPELRRDERLHHGRLMRQMMHKGAMPVSVHSCLFLRGEGHLPYGRLSACLWWSAPSSWIPEKFRGHCRGSFL